jgi:hypothetical protein
MIFNRLGFIQNCTSLILKSIEEYAYFEIEKKFLLIGNLFVFKSLRKKKKEKRKKKKEKRKQLYFQ